MKLYVANTTKQRHVFAFRALETGRMRQYPLQPGSQMMVMDGSIEDVQAIIDHYEPYGLTEASKIDQADQFIGLVYSIDKPTPYGKIEKGLRDNDDFLTEQSFDRRQTASAALDETLNANDIGYKGGVEISAEQQVNKLDPADEQKIKETIKTDRAAKKTTRTTKRK